MERFRHQLAASLEDRDRLLEPLRLFVQIGEREVGILLRGRKLDGERQMLDRLLPLADAFVAESGHSSRRRLDGVRHTALSLDGLRGADGVLEGAGSVLEHCQRYGGGCVTRAGLLEAQRFGQSEIEELAFRQKARQTGVQFRVLWEALRRSAQNFLETIDIFRRNFYPRQHRERHYVLRQDRISGFERLAGGCKFAGGCFGDSQPVESAGALGDQTSGFAVLLGGGGELSAVEGALRGAVQVLELR